jgi:hypothetical protein
MALSAAMKAEKVAWRAFRGALRADAKRLFVHSGQATVLNDRRRFRVIVAGRRWGKTACARNAILIAARKPKKLIWYVAPTYRMARGIMWRELIDTIPRGLIVKINETLMTIFLANGTIIECKGADKPDTLRGTALDLVVIDEAQDVRPDTWYLVLRATLASTGGDAIIIGTPKSFNWLYDVYMLGQRGDNYFDRKEKIWRVNPWRSWQFPTITSPFIPPEEIEAARGDMDEKSFRQEFEACHLLETQVRMWNGEVKAIRDIRFGDELIHITPDGERIPTSVLRIGETGRKIICDVILETGEIISASAHHKFKVHRADAS